MPEDLLICYNRGCGKKFKKEENDKESCTFHPGTPVFHDAYKGWSCCKKKCTDFTEFLNIKGCTISYHSNDKPPEPEKPEVDKEKSTEVIEVRAPTEAAPERLPRPPFDSSMTLMKPKIASSLASQLELLVMKKPAPASEGPGEIPIGTSCKHGGCKAEYQGLGVDLGPCVHHPGSPVFHEGLKFWSCCTKRTTEFSAFLDQVGCVSGDHKWTEDVGAQSKPVCRHDWHQTGTHVVVSVYAKKYNPNKSTVELNPIRAKIGVIFPESDEKFEMDIELRGIIDVEKSEVNMLATKIEINLRKAEPGSWNNLGFPRAAIPVQEIVTKASSVDKEIYDDDPVDLSDIN